MKAETLWLAANRRLRLSIRGVAVSFGERDTLHQGEVFSAQLRRSQLARLRSIFGLVEQR
jgi:hypothetical protein